MSSNTNTNYRTGLPGEVYGRLTVVAEAPRRGSDRRVDVRCECGAETTIYVGNIRGGKTVSCGCWRRESMGNFARRHGHTGSKEHRSWCAMVQRCTDKNYHGYQNYGGRGITIDETWRGPGGFEAFLKHIGPKPSRHSLDRIDNDGNYEPGNVKWSTAKEQSRNRRNTTFSTFRGETKSTAEWAEVTGIARATINARLKAGWSVERALTTPVRGTK